MGIEATGTLHTIFNTVQVSERFSKREFVVELNDNPKYPQLVLFQATGDRCEQLDNLQVGDEVKIEFSLRGREWRSPKGETKYFNSLDVWKVERKGSARQASNQRRDSAPAGGPPNVPPPIDDDIPFASSAVAHEPSPIAKVLR
jgi:hypothetical protein